MASKKLNELPLKENFEGNEKIVANDATGRSVNIDASKIASKNDVNGVVKSVSVNGGTPVSPDTNGKLSIDIGSTGEVVFVQGTIPSKSLSQGVIVPLTIVPTHGKTDMVSDNKIVIPKDGLYTFSMTSARVPNAANCDSMIRIAGDPTRLLGYSTIGGDIATPSASVTEYLTAGTRIEFLAFSSQAQASYTGAAFSCVLIG